MKTTEFDLELWLAPEFTEGGTKFNISLGLDKAPEQARSPHIHRENKRSLLKGLLAISVLAFPGTPIGTGARTFGAFGAKENKL